MSRSGIFLVLTLLQGYYRKAEALYHLGRLDAAFEVANAGLIIKASSDLKSLKQKIEKAKLAASPVDTIPPKLESVPIPQSKPSTPQIFLKFNR